MSPKTSWTSDALSPPKPTSKQQVLASNPLRPENSSCAAAPRKPGRLLSVIFVEGQGLPCATLLRWDYWDELNLPNDRGLHQTKKMIYRNRLIYHEDQDQDQGGSAVELRSIIEFSPGLAPSLRLFAERKGSLVHVAVELTFWVRSWQYVDIKSTFQSTKRWRHYRLRSLL